jgi:opacity protein-like surface antigen
MKKQLSIVAALVILATQAALADTMSDQHLSYDQGRTDLYRGNELSFDAFGTDALGRYTLNHLSGNRISHDSRLGLGVGANYFFIRYLGVGVEAFSENTAHTFVDDASANLIARIPIGATGLAPYGFVGGGHQWDPIDSNFGQAGLGLEFRFTRNIGLFVDGRGVWSERARNYGLFRTGVRFAL